jgi:hypothetical protein
MRERPRSGYDRADTSDQEGAMASRAETVATQFEAKVQEATKVIEGVSIRATIGR